MFPVNDTEDVFNHPQLLARDFFKETTIGDKNDKLRIPGPFITPTGPSSHSFKSAPKIGEHNLEVYMEIGLTLSEIEKLMEKSII